ncbi:MAG: hypothetical protein ACHQ0Y_13800 [Thermodesulfovibrionales bacterium]|jgi:hypothetical protein
MKQWKAIASVILVFLLGAMTGALVTHTIYRQKMENIIKDEPRTIREVIVQRLDRKLSLDPAQLEQVRAIVRETHSEMKNVRKQIRPQIDEILTRSQAKVRAILRPDQLEKYEKILAERKKRRETEENNK